MIPVVKIRGLDFIGTEYEDAIWAHISDKLKTTHGEFIIHFHGETSQDVQKISESVMKHSDSLRIRTNITLSELCKKFVFLDITSNQYIDRDCDWRFQIKDDSPLNIIYGLSFIDDYLSNIKSDFAQQPEKRQKRNDSTEFNYNKR